MIYHIKQEIFINFLYFLTFFYLGHVLLRGQVPFTLGLNHDRHWKILVENAIALTIWITIAVRLDKAKIYYKL